MSGLRIVRACEADRAYLVRCMGALQDLECALEEDRESSGKAAAPQVDHVLKGIEERGGATFIARLDDAPVGFIMCTMEEDSGAYVKPSHRRWGYVNDVYVAEEARGAGVADALMSAAEAHCRALGATSMKLFVLANNDRARAFYEKIGWAPYEVFYRKTI